MSGPPAVVGSFETIGELMGAAVEQIGDHEAIVDGDRRLSFADWVRSADGVARHFVEAGVGPRDVVALHMGNGIEYAVAYAAAARLGAITTGINQRLGPREIDSIIERARPRLLIADTDTDAGANLPSLPTGTVLLHAEEIRTASAGPPIQYRPQCVGSDPVCIIWTSGTTGTPKGAWFDHRNLEAAVASGGVMTKAHDRRLGGVPFAHAGYMSKLWEHFAMGLTLVLSPTPWTVEAMLTAIVDEGVTVAAGVPTQWTKLVELAGIDEVDFSALRIGLSATAPATPELIEQVATLIGCPLVVRYAMTESPSITGTEADDPPDVQYRTVGRPQQGMEVRIMGEAGQPVAAGKIGRVQVRGGCVMRGYWDDPVQTAEVLDSDGWLTSSDLGSFDDAGNLVLAGRIDDMYIRGGFNVYPVEVENVLADHPAIGQVTVVGVATPVIGEIGVAVVVPAAGAEAPTLDELRSWVGNQLADYKRPDDLLIVDALPLTAMSKVDKLAARDLAESR